MRRLGCLALLLLASCAVRTEPVAYVETTSGPYGDYWTYPSTVYGGRTVYLVDNRWMYPDRGRWYTYQVEPAPLYQYRQRTYVRSAPPAPPRAYPPGAYPPGTYPPPYQAPYPAPYPPPGRRY